MNRIQRLLAIVLCLCSLPAWSNTQTLELQVGETRVLPHPGVRRVAIGNSQVASAVAVEGRELVVFA
ncbi:secretion protein, partial [Methylobacterium radiotolerans]